MQYEAVLVLVTTGTADEARHIADALLERRQAACVSIVPGVDSRFWWEGRLDAATESLLIIKTRTSALEQVVASVKELHSYEVPEVIALPIVGGNQEYLGWLVSEVQG